MKLTRANVQYFETIGRQLYIDTPANMEFFDGSPATDKDFRAVITLRAALATLKSMGLVDNSVELELKEPYSP